MSAVKSTIKSTFNYSGLMCPVYTAFANDSKRTIRYDVIDKYAAWIKQQGIKGVLVNGTTGEGVCQRFEERRKSFEQWNNACRKYDLKCMVHIGGTSVANVHDLAEHAEENEACAVLCLPELFFKPTCEEDLVDYLKKVAEHCPTRPIFYYHFPAFSGVNLWMPRFCDLAEQEIPNFGGIKFTSNDLNEGAACLKPGRKIFIGSNTILSGALALGFDSAILISLNVFPELGQAVYNAVQENRWKDAILAQNALTKRFNECGTALKAEFNRVNGDFACGPARKPSLNLNQN